MSRVIPPATVRPIQIAKGVVQVDLDKASKVTRQVPKTPPHSVLAPFPSFMQGHEEFWFVVTAITLALIMYLTDKFVFGGPGILEKLSTEWSDFFKELREECWCLHGTSHRAAVNKVDVSANDLDSARAVAPPAPAPKRAGGDRFSLGLARCCASLHVVCGHMYAKGAIVGGERLQYFYSWGFTWVPWFFMLSGFVLFFAQSKRGEIKEWGYECVLRHLIKIYPLYAIGLMISYWISRTQGRFVDLEVLTIQSWLVQAFWPPCIEGTLQMQCWFISCLLFYWAIFPMAFRLIQNMGWPQLTVSMAFCYALPWVITIFAPLAAAGGDMDGLEWYNLHSFGNFKSVQDKLVVFLKFTPYTFTHIFLLGMLVGRLRELLGKIGRSENELEKTAQRRSVERVLDMLAPMGYLGLLATFTMPALRPWGAKLSTRLSLLLPFQSSILLGLAGVKDYLPVMAKLLKPFNFLESYSLGIYVMQFICYNLWPSSMVTFPFFIFLPSVAVCVIITQKSFEALWDKCWKVCLSKKEASDISRIKTHGVLILPFFCTLLLVCSYHLSDSILSAPMLGEKLGLPAVTKLGDGMVDLRLPLVASGGKVINPTIVIGHGSVTFVGRWHERRHERSHEKRSGKVVTVLTETWQSDILMGSMPLGSFLKWVHGTKAAKWHVKMHRWRGLRTSQDRVWSHLCSREKFLPENNTLLRYVTTGPEDAKVIANLADGKPFHDIVFNSYPPREFGCSPKTTVSQMYEAKAVGLDQMNIPIKAVHLKCGSTTSAEKNWIPFNHLGKRYFVYNVLPHTVVSEEGEGNCGRVSYYTNYPPLVRLQAKMPGLAIRGSGQAVFCNATEQLKQDHYLAFFHIVDPKTKQYAHFAYRFKTAPPFDILQVSEQLPLKAMYSADDPGQEGFAFLSGVSIDDASSTVMITYGAGDLDPRVLVIPFKKFDSMFLHRDHDVDLHDKETEKEREEDLTPRSETSHLSGLLWIFLLVAWFAFVVISGKSLIAAQQTKEEFIKGDEQKPFLSPPSECTGLTRSEPTEIHSPLKAEASTNAAEPVGKGP